MNGRMIRLKNRRVMLLDLGDGTWVVGLKILESRKDRIILRTDIRLSTEALTALCSLFLTMRSPC